MEIPDLNFIPTDDVEEFDSTNHFEFELNNTQENISNNNDPSSGTQKNLSNDQCKVIYSFLLKNNEGGKLLKGKIDQIAADFGVHTRTIRRIWSRGKSTGNVCHLMTVNVGRKRCVVDLSSISQIPLNHRSTLRSLGGVMGIPTSILFRAMKAGYIRRNTNPIKPFLTDVNKRARLEFCLSMIDQSTIQHEPTFKDMYNIVHIYEKWFYMSKKSQRYYLLPEEEDLVHTCKSKNFIAKVMFLVVIGRPRFDSFMTETFSGKIGVFPFVVEVPAKRNNANRIAGTLETKPITSITRDVLFIHKYSGGMILDSVLLITSSYTMSTITMLYAQNLTLGISNPSIDLVYPGILLFLVGITGNFFHHISPSKLRENGDRVQYKIPRGGMFDFVICPHYLFEILILVGITFISQTLYLFCFAIGTGFYLIQRSYATR